MEVQSRSNRDLRFGPPRSSGSPAQHAARETEVAIATTSEPRGTHPGGVTPRDRRELANRVVNVVIAGTGLLLLSPLMVITAILVKAMSPGPVLYTQARVGVNRRRPHSRETSILDRRSRDLGGRPFTIYKFRSMTVNAEARAGAVWATKTDPRVMPFGRLMRSTRLDELPQLFNVLCGDMNIVGPRPERPSIVATLRQDIAEYPLRQLAKPGITGWAQINANYDTCLEDVRTKVRFDLEYLQRQGLAEDFKIMLRTLPVVVFRRGGW